jgi:hypothetical protein
LNERLFHHHGGLHGVAYDKFESILFSPMIPPTVGLPIPQTDHAVSVSLPTWDDNVAYEEGDPKLLDKMVGGYPRFVYHPLVRKVFTQKSYCKAVFVLR